MITNYYYYFIIIFYKILILNNIGKNYVVQFIANSLFERGVKSKFFKLFIASRDFPHNNKIDEYRVCCYFINFGY